MTFLDVWIGYAIFGVTLFSLVFVWAVRTRQFTDFDRARYIALNAAEQVESAEQYKRRPGLIDRYTWVFLVLLLLSVITVVFWLGLRNT